MFGNHGRIDAAADIELGCQSGKSGRHDGSQVVQNLVGDGFVERALIAITPHVLLQCLELYAALVRNVFQVQGCKIRLPGFRAQAGELGDPDSDRIVR